MSYNSQLVRRGGSVSPRTATCGSGPSSSSEPPENPPGETKRIRPVATARKADVQFITAGRVKRLIISSKRKGDISISLFLKSLSRFHTSSVQSALIKL